MRKRSKSTQTFYIKGADGFLIAAARRAGADPNSVAPNYHLQLLKQHLMGDNSALKSGTIGVYRGQITVAIQKLLDLGADPEQADEIKKAVFAFLDMRCGEPVEPRGSSRKVEVPELLELSDVFYMLKTRFLNDRVLQDLTLCLYLLCVPRLGMRPVELTWSRRNGLSLEMETAKRAGRPQRSIPLTEWPPEYIIALDTLLDIAPRKLSDDEFIDWRNALASRLARASMHSRKERRLALYCCRHIAFANWRDVGMSPEEIRRLAGHAFLNSQSHYARGKSGFGKNFMFLAKEILMDAESDQSSPGTTHAVSPTNSSVDIFPSSNVANSIPVQFPELPLATTQYPQPVITDSFVVEAMPQPVLPNLEKRRDIDALAHFARLTANVEKAVKSYNNSTLQKGSHQRAQDEDKKP